MNYTYIHVSQRIAALLLEVIQYVNLNMHKRIKSSKIKFKLHKKPSL